MNRKNKKQVYVISDTHFGHYKMLEYCGRPEDFEARLWAELYELPDDCILIHLGDFCIGQDLVFHKYLSETPYKKILVKGNHDNKSKSWYMTHGWDFVCDRFTWNLHGKNIIFSHQPVKLCENDYTINIHGHFHNGSPRLLKGDFVVPEEEERNNYILEILTNRHKLIACELTNYKPILLDKAVNL